MKKTLSTLFILVIFLFACRWVFSLDEYSTEEDEARAYNTSSTVKTVEGLNFRVEPDRSIVKVAGVYRPIDLDSYIALKFNKLEKKLDEVTAALNLRIDKLSQRLDALEKRVDRLSGQESPPAQNAQNETQQTLP